MAEAAKWTIEFDPVLADDLTHQILIAGVADDKRHVLGDGPVEAGRQIVKYDDAFASIGQLIHHMTADIAGAAGYKD